MKAVSYTHLDVYKRQDSPISACVALLFFRKGMSKNDSVANNSIADVNDSSRRR